MWDFNLRRAFGLVLRTYPFVLLRTAVYFTCSVLLIGAAIAGGWIGYKIAPDSSALFYGAVIGLGLVSGVVYFLREYFLYLAKAGHIAVLTELIEGRPLPKGQIAYARSIVSRYFVEASAFFAVDQVIKGILGAVNRVLFGLGSLIPGLGGVMGFVQRMVRLSLTYADEVILGLSFRTQSNDVWRTSRDGIVLYAQNYKFILKNAFFLAFVQYALSALLFVLLIGPAGKLAALMPGSASGLVAFVMALILTFSFKKALIDPILMTALLQVYYKAIAGQTPDPVWVGRLDSVSEKFRGLAARIRQPAAPTQAPPVPVAFVEQRPVSAAPMPNVYPPAPVQHAYPAAPMHNGYPQAPAQNAYPAGPMHNGYPQAPAPVQNAYPHPSQQAAPPQHRGPAPGYAPAPQLRQTVMGQPVPPDWRS